MKQNKYTADPLKMFELVKLHAAVYGQVLIAPAWYSGIPGFKAMTEVLLALPQFLEFSGEIIRTWMQTTNACF
jgi:hypothetical protein